MVKNLPALWETQVQLLDWEDPLEKEMATGSSCLEYSTEEPGGLQSRGLQRSDIAFRQGVCVFVCGLAYAHTWKLLPPRLL